MSMIIKTVKLSELKPSVYNPRKKLTPEDVEYQQLKLSIEEFGLVDPLVVNERNSTIIGGHQRFQVMLDMGIESAEVSLVDLPEDREKALNIALNKISGDWDIRMLRELLVELDTGDFDMNSIGYSPEELESILVPIQPVNPEGKVSDVITIRLEIPVRVWLKANQEIMEFTKQIERISDGIKVIQ